MHFTLYSRGYCHLCDDMLQALQAFGITQAFTIEVVDVDADAVLVARYDEWVPVLMASRDGEPPVQLCHYFLDEPKLRAFLES
ncbi:MAG: glutaredoxin family protein [Burkholderiales bacterium]